MPTDQLFSGDSIIEHQGVTLIVDDVKLNVINIYIPPVSCCSTGYRPNLDTLLSSHEDDTIIMGDFNAHNSTWFSRTGEDQAISRGHAIVDLLNTSNLALINEESPTRVPNRGPSSSPDLTIVSPHLSVGATWQPLTTLCSDHLPVIITLADWFPEPPTDPYRKYTNIRKARWADFTAETEARFLNEPLPSSCSAGEVRFREILQTASKHHIPSGFIRNHLTNLSELRTSNPTDPNIPSIDNQLADTIAADNRRRWRTELDSFSHRQDSGRLWRTMATVSGKKPKTSPNQPITFSSHTHTNKRKIATAFCRQFSNTVVHTTDRAARAFKRKVVRDHPLDQHIPGFSTNMVVQAIKACSNSIATGPDGLTMLHIKHLGPQGISYLTHLTRHSLNMEAGHHYSDSQGRQTSPPWVLLPAHLPSLPWSKSS